MMLISDYPEVPEESTDFCLSEFFIMHKYRSRPGDPLTLSVLFYSSIQGFAEVLANRENLTIPKKEWFLAILKSEHRRQTNDSDYWCNFDVSRNYNKHSLALWIAFRRTDYGWTIQSFSEKNENKGNFEFEGVNENEAYHN